MNFRLINITRFLCVAACLAATVWAANGQTAAGANDSQTVPRFEAAACAVPVPDGVKAQCGNLFVRENRRKPAGRAIRLSVVIIKSTAPDPASDPVFYTGGGPGGSSLGRARGAANLVPITRERDFIIFEQRGTRFAEPSLQCPEVNDALHESRARSLSAARARRNEVRAAARCRARLVREGVDLAAYNSAASAADMEDLRRALGIGQWNLYGISYSTRLMLNYIREYGANVRSVILDSVLPPTVNWDETDIDGVFRALDVLYANCARDAKCAAAYPNLKEKLAGVIRAANKKPLVVGVVRDGKPLSIAVDGNMIFDFIYNLLEDNGALARIPAVIDALGRGQYDELKQFIEGGLTSQGFIWGMRYSVWCSEEMPFQDRRKIAAQAAKYPLVKGFKIQDALPDICKVWNVPAAGAVENRPVTSNVPALIFAGEYDPDTPPAWGKLAASWLPNSFFYEIKNATHGAIANRCTFVDIAAAFVKDPTVKPDDRCLSEIRPMEFK